MGVLDKFSNSSLAVIVKERKKRKCAEKEECDKLLFSSKYLPTEH